MGNNPEVTSIGDINVDLIASRIERMPTRDSQVLVSDIGFSSGGCSANFAKALNRLGAKVRFIGKIGKDLFGEFIRKELEGVDLRLSIGSKTGITFGLTFKDDTRSFITYPGANSELTLCDIDLKLIEGRFLHIASFFLQGLREDTVTLIDCAHKKGMKVSFDTGWDPRGWSRKDKNLVEEILHYVDVFFPNVREGEAITGLRGEKKVCGKLLSLGPEVIALKCGKRGSYIATRDDVFFVPPFNVEVVDTTGAGDVFDAAFIFGLLREWDYYKTAKFANAAAALSTTGFGSLSYPTTREVEELLSTNL